MRTLPAENRDFDLVEVNISHGIQEPDSRLRMPSSTSQFEPCQMSTRARSRHDHIRILRDLGVRHRLVAGDGIIDRVDAQHRNSNRHYAIRAARIAIVRAFCWIAPGGALHSPIELVKESELVDFLNLNRSVLRNLLLVGIEKSKHVSSLRWVSALHMATLAYLVLYVS